jgi:peptidoglycan/LPS O-acetylase OafA/YrhL
MPIIEQFPYRPDIDGLRAIAVLVVIAFHAGLGCPGGYVGVDVFFVISGFLITSLIWKDLETGRFTFAHFWERRARRIVPALVAVTLATLAAGWFVLLPIDLRSLGRASAAQAVFAANIHYWRDSGYFAGAAHEKPLLHTWSLAVEEQFYLIVPFLFWGMYRFAPLRQRTAVLSLLAAGLVLSLTLSIVGVMYFRPAAFFMLPTRAWELLLGSLVVFLPAPRSVLGLRAVREVASLAGMALVLVPSFIYTAETPFPGLAALPPCLGTALLIWANGRNDGRAATALGALLSARPIVFIGLISYSLYLWHWPLLAFGNYLAPTPLTAGQRAVLVSCGFVLAVLSWRFVETPFRTRARGASRKSMFALAGAGLAAVFVCGVTCMIMRGFPERLPPQALAFADAKADMDFINELTTEDIWEGKLAPLGVADPARPPALLVWGDSHAMAALPAIDLFLKERGLAGRAATHSSTAPVLNWFKTNQFGLRKDALEFNEAILSYIERQKIPDVILSGYWSAYAENDGSNSGPFEPALLETVRRLVAAGARPWILLDAPVHSFQVPTALSRSVVFQTDLTAYCAKPTAENEFDSIDRTTIAAILAAGGRILDPKPSFLDATGRYYRIEIDGIALYRDAEHLTTHGAKRMLLPLFREHLTLK